MRIAMGVLALLGLAASGCIIHARPGHLSVDRIYDRDEDVPRDVSGQVVTVERGHVHGDGCGHYWHNGQWLHLAGHVHRAGCGHVFHNGLWVLAAAVAIGAGHAHSDHCGHYFHDGKWFLMHGHRHGPGCGHHYDKKGRIWVAVIR